MKSYKGNMLLIELVIVILFFSLSQVAIVQMFAFSHQKNADSQLKHHALMAAQDVAETLSCAENMEKELTAMGFTRENDEYALSYEDGYVLYVALRRLEQPAGQLETATLKAVRGDEILLSLPCARYKGARR